MPDVQYQILHADRAGTPQLEGSATYDDPQEAARVAKYYSKVYGEKLVVKPVMNQKWKDRELQRKMDGTYRSLPWAVQEWWRHPTAFAVWQDQFPHPSVERPGWLAYTRSPEDGMKDKQTVVRPGAYLKKYFEHVMAIHGVRERTMVELFMKAFGPIDIKFAATEEEIVSVYEHGPKTCMVDKYWPGDGRNPAYVYAAGDLQVAYLGDLENASARALVWPEKKKFSRMYGDIARLSNGLERLGYKWGAPIGAKIKKVQVREPKFDPRRGPPTGCFIVPYIDKKNQQGGGHLAVIDKGDHLVICEDNTPGSHHCGLPDGVSGQYVPRLDEAPTFTCDRCEGAGLRKLTSVFIDADGGEEESWCLDCVNNDAFQCHYSGRYYHSENVEYVEVEGNIWNAYYAEMYAAKCEMTDTMVNADNLRVVYFRDGTAKKVSTWWITDNGGTTKSSFTNHLFLRRDIVGVNRADGGRYNAGRPELKNHAFQCDECGNYGMIGERNQAGDKLHCHMCFDGPKPKPSVNNMASSAYDRNNANRAIGAEALDAQRPAELLRPL